MMKRHGLIVATAWIGLTLAWAQAQQPAAAPRIAADRMAVLAQMALQGGGEPTAAQLHAAGVLFDQSLEWSGEEGELWRWRGELARLSGDTDRWAACLKQYVRINPADDPAQLQLILHRVEQEQTLDARLTLVERLLQSDAAASLSPPLRSRLASYAAAAALEIADKPRWARWLKESLKLDDTNPHAARMTWQSTVERTADPLAVGAALVHRVRAAPADPSARLMLARHLLSQSAFEIAAQQFATTSQLAQGPLAAEDWVRYMIAQVGAGRSEQALAEIEQIMQALAPPAASEAEDPPALDPAQAATLLPVELIRLAILDATAQAGPADESFARLVRLSEQAANPDDPTAAVAAVIFNRQLERAQAAAKDERFNESTRQRLAGWVALRRGDNARAIELLQPLADQDPAAALGVAMAQDDPARRRAQWRALLPRISALPLAIPVLIELAAAGEPAAITDAGTALVKLMERTSRQLWHVDPLQSPWVAMKLRVLPPRSGYLEPIELEVTLRNVSGVALAIGAGEAISSRLWVIVEPSVAGRSLGMLPPTVVDLGRTLRLEPGHELTHRLRLDRGLFGYLRSTHPQTTYNWRVTAVLDPRTNAHGVILPGPVAVQASLSSLLSVGMPATAENVDLWLADLASEDDLTRCRAAARLLGALKQPADDADPNALRAKIAQPLIEHYATLDRPSRAWVVSLLPPADDEQAALLQPIFDDAERSDDPMIRLPYLVAVADDADDNALLSALRHADPTIRTFAESIRDMLQQRRQAEQAQQENPSSPGGEPSPAPAED